MPTPPHISTRIPLDAIPVNLSIHTEDFSIVWANQRWQRATQLTPDQFKGKTCHELRGEKHPCKDCPLKQVLTTGAPAQANACLGTLPPNDSWQVQALPLHGKKKQVLITAMDMGRPMEKQASHRIHPSTRMASLGYLAGSIAHDVNNMLSVIFGYIDILLEDEDMGPEGQNALAQIHDAARRSSDLTQQLLSFIRRKPEGPKPMDLNQAVQDFIPMLTQVMDEGIEIEWQPGKDLPPIHMDPVHMDQILMNLCINARNAMDKGGKITISTQASSPGDPGDGIRLCICDTGCGMPSTTREQIFDPFFTTRKSNGGSGIGLSTVHTIVTQNKGKISVDSTEGRGTCFTIHLPTATPQNPTKLPRGNNETILLVEDEQMILDMGTTMLKRLGYQVLTANSPAKALGLAEKNKIDLIITDIILPKMDGKQLVNQIQSIHPQARAMYISGYTAEIMVHRKTLHEGDPFLQKPFSKKDLAHRVHQELANRP